VTDDGSRRSPLGPIRCFQVRFDAFDRFQQLLDRTSFAGTADVRDFRSNVVPVDGQILHQIVHLSRDAPASEAEHR
jgi:hypothetical protein